MENVAQPGPSTAIITTTPTNTDAAPLVEPAVSVPADPMAPRLRAERVPPANADTAANTARNAPIVASHAPEAAPTHLAFVVDTSGSMREPSTGELRPIVVRKVAELAAAHPQLAGLQLLNADGRFLLSRRGTGTRAWHAATPELREKLPALLASNRIESLSDPVPGIKKALRDLHDRNAAGMRMAIYVLGDEIIADTTIALSELNELNPRNASGRRDVAIHALTFPTGLRPGFPPSRGSLRFASLMRALTHEHGGTFVAPPDL